VLCWSCVDVSVVCRYKSVGKLSSGHQAAIMKLAIDDTDTADGNICIVTGAKDHYVKVSASLHYVSSFAASVTWSAMLTGLQRV